MTDLKPEDLAHAVERLTKASNTFPAHIGRDGMGMISVRQADVFLVLGELERLLADRARMEKALRAAAVYLDALGANLLRNDADMMLDECRDPKDVAEGIRQALGASQ